MNKDEINNALNTLESMNKGDQGANPPLNSAEGDDMGVSRGEPMSNEAKGKKAKKDKKAGGAMKSFKEGLPEEVEEQIDVSDFLRSLVDHTGTKMDELTDHLSKGELAQTEFNDGLTDRFDRIEKSQAMLGIILKSVCEKMGIIENEAATEPKSQSVSKSEAPVTERNFEAQDENATIEKGEKGEGEPLFKGLSQNPVHARGQMSDALCDLVKSGDASDVDVINFEMNGYIRPEHVTKLKAVFN